jgi:NAD(P)-dependent dehydrogenase (short-subunit alcohol dehydrogenase family)
MSTELEKGNHMEDVLRYEGTRAVVTGAASGMGAATATILAALGAEVHGLDIRPCGGAVHGSHLVDLSDTDQIDAAVEAIGGPIDSLFNCAGLPTTAPRPSSHSCPTVPGSHSSHRSPAWAGWPTQQGTWSSS